MTSSKRFYALLSLPAILAATQAFGCNSGSHTVIEGSSGTGGGADVPVTCEPARRPGCALDQECLATTSNAGKAQSSFRVVSLDIAKPVAFSQGISGVIARNSFLPNLADCSTLGSGSESWLIQLDLGMGKLVTGAAVPGPEGPKGYHYYNRVFSIGGVPRVISPVTFDLAQDADGTLRTTSTGDLYLPVLTSPSPNQTGMPMVFPLHDFSMHGITVSASGNCIGRFTPDAYAQDDQCDLSKVFSPAGTVDAYIPLDEADTIVVPDFGETLCVALSGDITTFGDSSQSPMRCKRTQGVIDFAGDWCAGSGPATAECHDAVLVHAEFAAAAVDVVP